MVTPPNFDPTPEDRLRAMLRVSGLPVRASYRVDEVATMLDICRSTLYEMMGDGSLRYIRVRSRSRRIDWATLVEFLAHDPEESEESE